MEKREQLNLKDYVVKTFDILKNVDMDYSDNDLLILMDNNLKETFSVNSDLVRLTFDKKSIEKDALPVFVGSKTLMNISDMFISKFKTGICFLNIDDIYFSNQKLLKKIKDNIHFNGMLVNFLDDDTVVGSTVIFNYKVEIITSLKNEFLYSVAIDRTTGIVNNDIINLYKLYPFYEGEPENIFLYNLDKYIDLDTCIEKANLFLKKYIQNHYQNLKKNIEVRISDEILRVEKYFLKNIKELERKKNSKARSENIENDLTEKIELNKIEMQRKINELISKSGITVNSNIFGITILSYPKLVQKAEIKYKNWKKEINLYWNPISKSVEKYSCEKCCHPTYSLNISKDYKVVCENCFNNSK